MGVFKSFFGVMAKPYVQTAKAFSLSGQRLKADIDKLRATRERLRRDAAELKQKGNIETKLSDEQLVQTDPATIKDPEQRFRALYLQNSWTEAQLSKRLRAVKGRKYLGMALCLAMLFGGMISIITAPAWLALVMFAITVFGAGLGAAMTFLHGLYQSQLETRSLHGAMAYLERRDFVSHLFS